jgi:hypothetical protein
LRTRFQAKRLAGGYLAINKGQLAQLPIRIVDAADGTAVSIRCEIIELVDRIAQHRHPIDAVDRRIDRLVYELYQLTETEIEAVERSFPTVEGPGIVKKMVRSRR